MATKVVVYENSITISNTRISYDLSVIQKITPGYDPNKSGPYIGIDNYKVPLDLPIQQINVSPIVQYVLIDVPADVIKTSIILDAKVISPTDLRLITNITSSSTPVQESRQYVESGTHLLKTPSGYLYVLKGLWSYNEQGTYLINVGSNNNSLRRTYPSLYPVTTSQNVDASGYITNTNRLCYTVIRGWTLPVTGLYADFLACSVSLVWNGDKTTSTSPSPSTTTTTTTSTTTTTTPKPIAGVIPAPTPVPPPATVPPPPPPAPSTPTIETTLPDLRVSDIEILPGTTLERGQIFSVFVSISNDGTADCLSNFNVFIILKDITGNRTFLKQATVGGLNKSAQKTVEVIGALLSTNARLGNSIIEVSIDPGNGVVESSKLNNISSITVNITDPNGNTSNPPTSTGPSPPRLGDPSETQVSQIVDDSNSQALYGILSGPEFQSDYIETVTQCIRVAENIIWEHNNTIIITMNIPFDPTMRKGKTGAVVSAKGKGFYSVGIIRDFSHKFNIESGEVYTQIRITATEYIFQSILGGIDRAALIDQRM